MTTKVIIEEMSCKKEETPQKSLEKAFELLKTNPDVQARIKNMVVTGIHINGNNEDLTVTLDFTSVEIASDPSKLIRKMIVQATENILRKLKEEAKAANKEESHD